uniref:KAT8 regulatory NSL complex subunit 1 n=1 Tax=Sinocyclocheilus grahami TaxID=75366 RepID=A0A672RP28_SINGR
MAAMAPALTDAPAEARHIRFKLASPSSTLSPGSTENNSNASNILISDSVSDSAGSHTNGKCHINEQDPLSKAPSLGKLAPYLCSDVKPLPSSTKVKESLKLQGVLIKQSVLKSHGLLSSSIFPSAAAGSDFLLRKRHALELTGGQLKSLVNGTGAGSTMVPVNGLSKKVAVPSAAVAEKGSVATVNGDSNQPSTNGEALLSVSSKSVGTFATGGQNGDVKPQQNLTPSIQGVSSQRELTALSESAEVNAEPESPVGGMVVETNSNNVVDCPSSLSSSPVHDDSSPSTPNLEALLWDRAQQSQHRQTDIEGRLLRLRKRLQVVQAKQVERHFKQQLAGFLDRTLTPTSSRRADPGAWRGSRASVGTHAHNLSRFLKGGRVALELDQLHLSGTTHLRVTEAQFDSDATESSSGGESDIEEEELTRADVDQRHIKLWRRAEGRFARERATIISHWTWLQAQISDLEYRIRQQVDVYRQLRASKGECSGVLYQHRFLFSIGLAKTGFYIVSTFSYFSSVTEMSGTCPSNLDSSCTSARTRPLLTCRRRRLIHPNTVHNGKVQRVSFSPLCVCEVNGSCVMCGGAPPLSKPDLPFDRPLLERVAHQDRSIHPVLSMQSGEMHMHSQIQLKLTTIFRFFCNCIHINSIVISLISLKMFLLYQVILKKCVYASFYFFLHSFHNMYSNSSSCRSLLVENLSDASFTKLHQPLEEQERSRWRWTALAPGKRRGSRSYKSLDGRTTPSIVGTNPPTPQPSSPDASHFHILQDYGPVPSPLSPPSPDTPCSRDAHTPHTRDTHRLLYSEDTCGSTSDCTFEETVTRVFSCHFHDHHPTHFLHRKNILFYFTFCFLKSKSTELSYRPPRQRPLQGGVRE